MNVALAKPGAELGEDGLGIRACCAARTETGRWPPSTLIFSDAEVRPDQDMNRRMLDPI